MAKKKDELATKEPAELAVPEALQAIYDEAGGGSENLEHVDNPFFVISTLNGRFNIEGERIGANGDSFDAVIAHLATCNAFYADKYDPNTPSPPDCASVGGVEPDSSSKSPQSKLCATCEHMKWGTAIGPDGQPSRGRKCRQSKRLVLHYPNVDLPCLLSIPPTSLKTLEKYLKLLSTKIPGGIPVWGVVTAFSFDPSASFVKLNIDVSELIQDVEKLTEIRALRATQPFLDAKSAYMTQKEAAEAADVEDPPF